MMYGQSHILKQIDESLKHDRIAHAYVLVGPPHVGKMALALGLAQKLNCLGRGSDSPCNECNQCIRIMNGHHADVQIIGAERAQHNRSVATLISVDEIREVLHRAHLKPYEGNCRVIIFDGADSMSDAAANALLKTLEEPPPQMVMLLLTANEEVLLSTVRSRCRRLQLLPMRKEQMAEKLVAEHNADSENAEQLARLSRGCIGWAISALKDPGLLEQRRHELVQVQEISEPGLEKGFDYAAELAKLFSKDRGAARDSLYVWLRWWRDLLLIKEGVEEYVHNVDWLAQLRIQAMGLTSVQIVNFLKNTIQTVESLDSNASPRLVLDALMLSLPVAASPSNATHLGQV
jgi:DNA polymerase-3 subunit delta'